jgi:hypothetical protein
MVGQVKGFRSLAPTGAFTGNSITNVDHINM